MVRASPCRTGPNCQPGPSQPQGTRIAAVKAEEAAETMVASRSFAAGSWPPCSIPRPRFPPLPQASFDSEIAAIAVPATTHGRNMFGDDFGLRAGWGHFGSGPSRDAGAGPAPWNAPIHGIRARRHWAPHVDTLGESTYDIHLNDNAYWRNVPGNVWNYRLGGYQVLKKWLSYRGAEGAGAGAYGGRGAVFHEYRPANCWHTDISATKANRDVSRKDRNAKH